MILGNLSNQRNIYLHSIVGNLVDIADQEIVEAEEIKYSDETPANTEAVECGKENQFTWTIHRIKTKNNCEVTFK
jgi:hypothetical protein